MLFAEQLATARRIREPTLVGNYGVGLLVIRREQGRLHEFERATHRRVEELPQLAAWRVGLALILIQGGRLDEAAEHFEWLAADDFASVADDVVQYYNLVGLSDVAIALGDRPTLRAAARAAASERGAGRHSRSRRVSRRARSHVGQPRRRARATRRTACRTSNARWSCTSAFGAAAWAARNRYDLAAGLVQRDGER